ncbi:MAG: hypothetical protein ACYDHB_13630 [Candidatus Dormibacteria bacterium]
MSLCVIAWQGDPSTPYVMFNDLLSKATGTIFSSGPNVLAVNGFDQYEAVLYAGAATTPCGDTYGHLYASTAQEATPGSNPYALSLSNSAEGQTLTTKITLNFQDYIAPSV